MTNQAITNQAILAVYEEIQRRNLMHDIVELEELKHSYRTEALAMWETLQTILGHETMSETIDLVRKLAKENKAAA